MKNKLTIQLGNKKIVAEIYDNNGPDIPPEMCVYIEDEAIIQDICLVRPHYDINRKTKEFYNKLKEESKKAPSTILKIAMNDIWFFTDGLQRDY